MSNKILEFKEKEKTLSEKIKDITKSESHILFYITENNDIVFSVGKMTNMQMAYINKLLDMMTTNMINETTEETTNGQ